MVESKGSNLENRVLYFYLHILGGEQCFKISTKSLILLYYVTSGTSEAVGGHSTLGCYNSKRKHLTSVTFIKSNFAKLTSVTSEAVRG